MCLRGRQCWKQLNVKPSVLITAWFLQHISLCPHLTVYKTEILQCMKFSKHIVCVVNLVHLLMGSS